MYRPLEWIVFIVYMIFNKGASNKMVLKGATTLSIVALSIMTSSIMALTIKNIDSQHINIKLDNQHNDTQHNGTQHKGTRYCNVECHLCWVSLCSMSRRRLRVCKWQDNFYTMKCFMNFYIYEYRQNYSLSKYLKFWN